MSAIIIPRRHYTQPHGRLSAAPEWVANGLAALIAPGQFAYSHIGGVLTRNGTQPVVTPAGVGASFSSGSSDYLSIPVDLPPTGFMTLFFVGRPSAAAGFQRAVNLSANTHQRFNFHFLDNGTVPQATLAKEENANSYMNLPASAEYPKKTSVFVVVFYRSGVSVRVKSFVDGQFQGDFLIANEAAPTVGSTRFDIGRLWVSGTPYYSTLGSVLLGGAINDAISDADSLSLSANPWQLFRADPIRIYSFPSGPIIPTLSGLTTSNITSSGARHSLTLTF